MTWREAWCVFFRTFRSLLPKAALFVLATGLIVVLPTFLLAGPTVAALALVACTVVGIMWGGYRLRRSTKRGTVAMVVAVTFLSSTTAVPLVANANPAPGPTVDDYLVLCPTPQECADHADDCPEGCGFGEKLKAYSVCALCFAADLTCIGSAWAAWTLPWTSPQPKLAAIIVAIGSCLAVYPACIICAIDAWECNLFGMAERAERAIDEAQEWIDKLREIADTICEWFVDECDIVPV
jgi:hypothetical protein